MEYCCICQNIIKKDKYGQNIMKTRYGYICNDCLAKGYWEKLQDISTDEEFQTLKNSVRFHI